MKYFKMEEFNCPEDNPNCMDPILLGWLNRARDVSGIPYIITSGFRTPEENTIAGGVKTSSHLTGEAVDIACPTSATRWKILRGIFFAGLPKHILDQIKEYEEENGPVSMQRIGIGNTFIHVDTDVNKPQQVVWTY